MKRYHRPHRALAKMAYENPLVGFNPLSHLPADLGTAAVVTGVGAAAGAGVAYASGKTDSTNMKNYAAYGALTTAALGAVAALASKKYREKGATTAVLGALLGGGYLAYEKWGSGSTTTPPAA